MRSLVTCYGVALAVFTATAHGSDSPGNQSSADAGRRIYAAECAACHGPRGEGQPDWVRPNAAGEMPAPPHDQEGHTWKHSDAMLYHVVKHGWRDPYNKTERLTMPAFGKTLWTPEQRNFQMEESEQTAFPSEAR